MILIKGALKLDWIKVADSVTYLILLLFIYACVKKQFARSNIFWLLIIIGVSDVVANWFGFTLIASLFDALIVGLVVAIVVSNDQKINVLLKRKSGIKERVNVSEERKQF